MLMESHIEYMVAGSVASSFHGEPRSTRDIDLFIVARPAAIDRLLSTIDRDRFYVPDRGARDAAAHGGQFNIVDTSTGWKFDLMVRRDRPFSESEFSRRVFDSVLGVDVWIATREDTILAKLDWSRDSLSERQFADVVSMLRVGRSELDEEYLDR